MIIWTGEVNNMTLSQRLMIYAFAAFATMIVAIAYVFCR